MGIEPKKDVTLSGLEKAVGIAIVLCAVKYLGLFKAMLAVFGGFDLVGGLN